MDPILYFYGDGNENYELSNFYPHPKKNIKITILFDGKYWPTSEHIYQALKFKCETDDEKKWRELIRTANTPTIAKYLGHYYTHIRYGWQNKYRDLVLEYKQKVR